ncbi:SET domain-containing protein [Trametes cingulata]|nr:SET domain-containing protein [Trametes cingulata]
MSVPYKLVTVPGKGKGLIAARAISRGELVLAERPLLTQERGFDNSTILKALAQLSDAQQREYFSLANAWKGVHPPPLGVFKTNALPCGDHEAGSATMADRAAVFALGSRFNSSCEPNVSNYWDESRREIAFWAVRDIMEGEELLISYGEHFATRSERRARLKERFHFDCECVACALPEEEVKASDDRRVEIRELYDEIAQCGRRPALGVNKVKQALKVLEQEGLLGPRGPSFYYDGFQFCACVADATNAKAWAQKAWEGFCATRGPNSPDALKMQKYKKNPRAHPAFGLLGRQTLVGPD